MGLLDNLLNRNPTRDWQPQRGLELVVDLDRESFCGVRLGEKVERLHKFGPTADAASARIGMFNYPTRGFQVSEEQGKFVEVETTFGEGDGARAFAGKVVRRGRSKVFTGENGEADLVQLLGPPSERKERLAEEDSPAGVTMLWRLVNTDFTADFEDGRLSVLWLGTKQ